jgi:hypothetical protein
MLHKLRIGLLIALFGACGLFVGTHYVNAANLPYDGKNPVKTGCSKTGVMKKYKTFSYKYSSNKYISGKVELMYSTKCKTAWAYIKLNNTTPKGYFVDGVVVRNNDRKTLDCESYGNGKIKPGQYTCYSGMVYDFKPNTSYATAQIFVPGKGWEGFQSNRTASY